MPEIKWRQVKTIPMAVVTWLRHSLLLESNNHRIAYGVAIVGHFIISLVLLFGMFQRTEPTEVAAMPVEIVMEEPAAPPPPPTSVPNEPNRLPSIPAVADADKHAKASRATRDVNGVDQPSRPGDDGGDPGTNAAGAPLPQVGGDLATGTSSLPSWAVAPAGLEQRQATAHEPGEDELTAIKEPKLECGAKARWPSPRTTIRQQAMVIGIASAAQVVAMTRSSQVMMDRRINPNYAANIEVFADTWEGKTAVVLPYELTVNVGDVIEFERGHVDPSDPCQYIPNLAVGKRKAS
jgi:hypothetical protein